jgi:HEAT repeat protein
MHNVQYQIRELTCGEDLRAEEAVHALASLGEAALPALHELVASPDADNRWWAAWALSSLTLPEASVLLRGLLKDPDLSVRQCAALGLREQPTPHAVPDLVELLMEEDSILVRLAGAALIAVGKEAVPALLELYGDGPHRARLEVVRTLAAIGDERAIGTLFEAFQSDSAIMEYWANEGLERLGIGMVFFNP